MTKQEFEQLAADLKKYENTLVLTSLGNLRLFSTCISDEEDYYYLLLTDFNKPEHWTLALKVIFLFEELSAESYNSLARIWNLNSHNTCITK